MIRKCTISGVCIFGKHIQSNSPLVLRSIDYTKDFLPSVRYINKHWNPKYKKERGKKFIKIDLPNFDEPSEELRKEQYRSRMKEYGLYPERHWTERPGYIASTSIVYDPYVPPEGDGKFSAISKEGAKQRWETVSKKGKSALATRKIKGFDDTFNKRNFLDEALEIYKKAHEALAAKDYDSLHQYITEHLYPKILWNTENKTIHWKFLESLEPARIVQVRCEELLSRNDLYAQVTVRFHTQQILAIYDRFGRLMQGSEILRKDVLDYIVFERHLANEYGSWRMHDKLRPAWKPSTDTVEKTYMLEDQEKKSTAKSKSDVVETMVPPKDIATDESRLA